MTQDEIIEMARQAGSIDSEDVILTVYNAFASAEREACADIAEKQRYAMNISLTSHPAQNGTAVGIANQIRARGRA
jgi:hypothetical protein